MRYFLGLLLSLFLIGDIITAQVEIEYRDTIMSLRFNTDHPTNRYDDTHLTYNIQDGYLTLQNLSLQYTPPAGVRTTGMRYNAYGHSFRVPDNLGIIEARDYNLKTAFHIGLYGISINDLPLYRPQTNAADLLPYVYGRVEYNESIPTSGTENYVVTRHPTFIELKFEEPIVDDLVITVTPEPYNLDCGALCSPEYVSQSTVYHHPTQKDIVHIYLFNSSGSIKPLAGFSFVAYKP